MLTIIVFSAVWPVMCICAVKTQTNKQETILYLNESMKVMLLFVTASAGKSFIVISLTKKTYKFIFLKELTR
jgi:hypothetical protein